MPSSTASFALTPPPAVLAGSFTDWQTPVPLRRSAETNDFIRTIALEPGTYQVSRLVRHVRSRHKRHAPDLTVLDCLRHLQYKFIVDGQWATSPVDPIISDGKVRLTPWHAPFVGVASYVQYNLHGLHVKVL